MRPRGWYLVLVAATGCQTLIGYEDSAPRPNAGGTGGATDSGADSPTDVSIDGDETSTDTGLGGTGGTGGTSTGGTGGTSTGGTGGTSTGGTGGTGGFAGACVDENGPATVTVPGGGVSVTLHATEVTRCQYAKFLETSPTQTANVARCAWNEDFTPDSACSAHEDYYAGAGSANHPQTCVDWCDAAEYCQHVGMRLCGAKAGGPLNEPILTDPTADQYFDACSSFGAHNYPYGGDPTVSSIDGFLPDGCNGNEHVLYETLPVAFLPTCQSSVDGYEGIFDLSGNASEWVDMCTEGALPQDDVCHARGGSFADNYGKQRCVDYSTGKRNEPSVYFGFRCCE